MGTECQNEKFFTRAEMGHISVDFWVLFFHGIQGTHQSNCCGHILANIS